MKYYKQYYSNYSTTYSNCGCVFYLAGTTASPPSPGRTGSKYGKTLKSDGKGTGRAVKLAGCPLPPINTPRAHDPKEDRLEN